MSKNLNEFELNFNYENLNVGDSCNGIITNIFYHGIYLDIGSGYKGYIDLINCTDFLERGQLLKDKFRIGEYILTTIKSFAYTEQNKLVALSLQLRHKKINDIWNKFKNRFKIHDIIPCEIEYISESEEINLYYFNNHHLKEFFVSTLEKSRQHNDLFEELLSFAKFKKYHGIKESFDIKLDDSCETDICVEKPDIMAEILEIDDKNKKVQFNLVSIVDK